MTDAWVRTWSRSGGRGGGAERWFQNSLRPLAPDAKDTAVGTGDPGPQPPAGTTTQETLPNLQAGPGAK